MTSVKTRSMMELKFEAPEQQPLKNKPQTLIGIKNFNTTDYNTDALLKIKVFFSHLMPYIKLVDKSSGNVSLQTLSGAVMEL